MSNQQPHPITTSAFATALTALPLSSLHAKAAELRNSLHHLRSSNAQLRTFLAEQGSPRGVGGSGVGNEQEEDMAVYADAIIENEALMARLVVRIGLLRREVVEVRGMAWVSGDGDEDEDSHGHGYGVRDGDVNGDGRRNRSVGSGIRGREVEAGDGILVDGEREGRDLGVGEDIARAGVSSGAGAGTGTGTRTGTRDQRAVNGINDDAHNGQDTGLREDVEQPDRRLTDEELQQRLRDRLGDQEHGEPDGVYL